MNSSTSEVMSENSDESLLAALLDSWRRNNTILVNLLRMIPADAFDLRAAEGSPTIGQLFKHMHYCRLIFVVEDAPEFSVPVDQHGEWRQERDVARIAEMLDTSADVVARAVAGRLASGRAMDRHYDHPILLLQHMIWHEGYHHGQIKLALKIDGRPLDDEAVGAVTWDVWMDKS